MKRRLAMMVSLGFTALAAAISQDVVRSTSDGVFTADQAARGKASYAVNCAVCHGDQLEGGGESGPSLSGEDFKLVWGGHTVGELVDRIQNTMPATQPGKLNRQENTAIAAYILSVNKFPAGSDELPSDASLLKLIRIAAEPLSK